MKKSLMLLTVLTAGLASAATYHVRLLDPTVVNGAELKPGEYKLDVSENRAIFHVGRKTVEAPVKVENDGAKHNSTTVRYETAAGKMMLRAIQIGGSNTTLVFSDASGS